MRWLSLLLLVACGSQQSLSSQEAQETAAPLEHKWTVPSTAQRKGDAARGYTALVNEPYISCGIPRPLFKLGYAVLPGFFFGLSDDSNVPGRTGANKDLPYAFTGFESKKGVDLVTLNCLACHASRLNGELVIGVGNNRIDFTLAGLFGSKLGQFAEHATGLFFGADAREELLKFVDRFGTVLGYFQTNNVGVAPFDIGVVLAAFREPTTLRWTGEANPNIIPDRTPLPVDAPPWWRVRDKRGLFYVGLGQGDHARAMMTASMYCTDSVDEARWVDSLFVDVQAYLEQLKPPRFPYAVNASLAAHGKDVFVQTCSRCHGTYGAERSYPNLLVPAKVVGTDDGIANFIGTPSGKGFVEWMRNSYYGEYLPDPVFDTGGGYMAPPLDGIWATAPFLHNGSVPSLQALLDSSLRPTYWTRDFGSNDIDPDTLGLYYEAKSNGHSVRTYDTTVPGYGNGGHTFGDALSEDDRSALIEYLKTL